MIIVLKTILLFSALLFPALAIMPIYALITSRRNSGKVNDWIFSWLLGNAVFTVFLFVYGISGGGITLCSGFAIFAIIYSIGWISNRILGSDGKIKATQTFLEASNNNAFQKRSSTKQFITAVIVGIVISFSFL